MADMPLSPQPPHPEIQTDQHNTVGNILAFYLRGKEFKPPTRKQTTLRPKRIFKRRKLKYGFIVEPCMDKISVNSNQLMHIYIKKHIKII